MNRTMIAVIALIVWSAAAFGAGWAWRGDRAEKADAKHTATNAQAQTASVNQARAVEHTQAATLADIGANHEEDRRAAEAVPAAVVAAVRAGDLQLRDDLATCNTARLSEAVAGAVERDAGAQLRAEVAGAVVQAGRDADDQLRAAQAVIAADRTEVTP
ncbi:hypothetical protein ARC20_03235 [Stenotrophomonas panacihumi]|uniref:Uncharacterized protein n=1 Tax=Stenotrophomonas panacihumi TaxID=676599 RepID=A0A0R0AQ52_9GAMM|nr:hypothetical protein [Stenotrophomonas panacihumi]KRG47357.1 hypothetical protein ARC20_03235 [Stenotrophomonas panacihumi]PTN55835.1 hypothetical protein C9J98_04475 [Stenotrophomonas panacihumi]